MHYQNHDLRINKFFLGEDRIVTDIATLKHKPLSRAIYFCPSNAPIVNIANVDQGSCFEGYTIPTASFIYTKESDSIVCHTKATNFDLSTYTCQVYDHINHSIKQIYQLHPEVTLCYSGGIDSIVLLSYIMAQGLLSRTRIVCFENHTQSNALALHNHADNKEKVQILLKKLEAQVKSISWFTITVDDIARAFNLGRLEHLKCYSTNAILQKYKGTAFLFGFHGNQILLHKSVFVDELFLHNRTTHNEVSNLLVRNEFYTQSLVGYNINKEMIGVSRTHMLQKPWSLLDGINGNCIYNPIGSDQTFDLLRSLDFKTATLADIADAGVARNMIERNVGTVLTEFIGVEGLYDSDVLVDTQIPISALDPGLLKVPPDLSHNCEGLDYVNYEIGQSAGTGTIPINALVSIKMLDWISQL